MRKAHLLIVLVTAVISAWLTTLVDHGLGLDWTHVAVRNWEQYGFFHLHGKMVTNPGGFQADTVPDIYSGHRSASLIPVFLCHQFCSAMGLSSLGFVAYNGIVAVMILLSVWWLLGRTEKAFCVAVVTVLAPGFIRWETSLDPNLAAALFGFPFCAAMVTLLRRPSLTRPQLAMLFLLIVAYSIINWTTTFVHALLFVTLFAMAAVPRRHLVIYAGLAAIVAGWVLYSSVANKVSAGTGTGAASAPIYLNYGWGNVGYGAELTTKTALSRLVTANALGLLPVLVCLGWLGRWQARQTLPALLCFLPLLVVAMEVLGLRNYFGHHPWMSVHFVLLGIILTAVLGMDFAAAASEAGTTRLPGLGWLALTAAYSAIVLFVGQARNDQTLAVAEFVIGHTSRSTTIGIRRDTDPALADLADRLARLVDRHVVVISGPDDPALAGDVAVFGADHAITGKTLAQAKLAESASPIVSSLMSWYGEHIAHRRAGDKLEFPGETFFLYQPIH